MEKTELNVSAFDYALQALIKKFTLPVKPRKWACAEI